MQKVAKNFNRKSFPHIEKKNAPIRKNVAEIIERHYIE